MRGAFGAVLALALCASGAARAVEEGAPAAAVPDDRVGLTEHELAPAERTSVQPPGWDGDLAPAEVSPSYWGDEHVRRTAPWVTEGLARRSHFLQPLWVPPVTIDYAARLLQAGGWNPTTEQTDIDQLLYVGFGIVEIYAPLFTLRDSETERTDHFRANLKIPLLRGTRHVLSARLATNLPVNGPLAADAGYRAEVGYGLGIGKLGAQVQVGFGSDTLLGELESTFNPSLFWDVSVGYTVLRELQLLVTFDGRDPIEGRGTTMRLWPGLRVFPFGDPTLSVAVSGLWWTQQGANEWDTRRAGGMIDVGYLFF